MPGDFEVSFGGIVQGFHLYKAVWTPVIGEELSTEREHDNPEDAFAVVIKKSGITVGHIPREIPRPAGILLLLMVKYAVNIRKKATVDSIYLKEGWKFLVYTHSRERKSLRISSPQSYKN